MSASDSDGPCGPGRQAPRLAYLMSRFPKLTETFVLNEILELRRLGFEVEVFPLLQHREAVQHPDVARLAGRVHHTAPWSATVLRANLALLLRRPGCWFAPLLELIRGNLPSRRRLLRGLLLYPKMVWMAQRARELGIDHVHAHFASQPALAALVIRRISGIGFSFTGHGSDLHVDQTMLDHKIAASRFCVMISDYNRRFVLEHARRPVAERLRLVRAGIDPDLFQAAARDRPPGAPLRILMVAALREVKGHRVLLDACRRLAQAGLAFQCRLAGDGPLRPQLAAQIRHGDLGRRIELLGGQPRDRVAALMAEADVLVMPSIQTPDGRREGIPVVLMEAMASGLAVVASRLSGIPELVRHEHDGLLFPPGDDAALAAALQRLQADPALRTGLGRRARERVRQDYDLRRNTRRLADLFCDPPPAAP